MFETVIRSNVKLQTAPAFRKTIYEHARCPGSEDYESLTDEVLERLLMRSNRLKAVTNE